MMPALSSYSYRVLQAATRTLKSQGTGGWCQGYLTDGGDRYCAVGRIHQADPFITIHGVSPAATQIVHVLHQHDLPMLARVNDGTRDFRGQAGYDGAIALMDHLLDVAAPSWAPSVVQGSQFEGVGLA
jgi:hypothetical protein